MFFHILNDAIREVPHFFWGYAIVHHYQPIPYRVPKAQPFPFFPTKAVKLFMMIGAKYDKIKRMRSHGRTSILVLFKYVADAHFCVVKYVLLHLAPTPIAVIRYLHLSPIPLGKFGFFPRNTACPFLFFFGYLFDGLFGYWFGLFFYSFFGE